MKFYRNGENVSLNDWPITIFVNVQANGKYLFRRTLATAAMAKYMHLTKPQLVRLRDTVLPYSKATQGMIEWSALEYGISKSTIENTTTDHNNNTSISDSNSNISDSNNDDTRILGHLFTMCDTGKGQVDCLEYIVGISVLACKTDSFGVAIRFALRALDVSGVGKIDSRIAFKLLRGESLRGRSELH